MNPIITIVGGVAIGYLILQGIQKADSVNKLTTSLDISAEIRRFTPSLLGGYIDLDVVIRNPVSAGVTIKKPTVRLSYDGTLLGQSDPNPGTVNVAENAITRFPLRVNYQMAQIGSPIWSMLQAAIAKRPIVIECMIYTGIVALGTTTELTKPIRLPILNA